MSWIPPQPVNPAPVLTSDGAVAAWHQSQGFRGFTAWLRRRCERLRGRDILEGDYETSPQSIQSLMRMLNEMIEWVKEVPPLPASGQRFGNLAFRTYIKLVEQRLPELLESFSLPSELLSQLLPLWLNSTAFGHPTRMDYGTGHELAFVLGLWCCVVSGWVGGETKEDEEDELILRVFTRYTDLTTLLQSTYRLEPAGSHGVWGLDDYCFLPYLFGAAQIIDTGITPSQVLSNALNSAPDFRPKDLYTLALTRVKLFKHGAAFSEHSPMLYSLSLMPSFQKPYSGLMKMFHGEVLGKKVVVQGLWVGGWCWGDDVPRLEGERLEVPAQRGMDMGSVGTAAPWATSGRQGVLDSTRGAWR